MPTHSMMKVRKIQCFQLKIDVFWKRNTYPNKRFFYDFLQKLPKLFHSIHGIMETSGVQTLQIWCFISMFDIFWQNRALLKQEILYLPILVGSFLLDWVVPGKYKIQYTYFQNVLTEGYTLHQKNQIINIFQTWWICTHLQLSWSAQTHEVEYIVRWSMQSSAFVV